jgi:TPR repeat protein
MSRCGWVPAFGLAACLSLLTAAAQACGWAGDAEARTGFGGDAVVVGADGKPVPGNEFPARGSPNLATDLGNRYRTGEGVPQDYATAVRWYRQAAEQGDADAQNNLAAMYEQGLGVEQDLGEAARWYRLAADQGDARAQHSLGGFYLAGRGVARDPAKAAMWIRRSAEQGHVKAINDLALLRWQGTGTARDPFDAYVWWRIASERGDEEATRWSLTIMPSLSAAQIAAAERRVRGWKPERE